jgi:FtsP/CotA-like multicopper oxidase with cupredoxin domain
MPPLVPNTGGPTTRWSPSTAGPALAHEQGVKEFHLVAEPGGARDGAGLQGANLWGYNGQSPGPTIEVVEGDRVRIFVTNKLPEHTSIHWHGQRLPNGMDGVAGLTSRHQARQDLRLRVRRAPPGTFMYHPHADEMTQMAMGMMGILGHPPQGPSIR